MASGIPIAIQSDDEVEYPTGDGKPIAETPIHRQNLTDLIAMVEEQFAGDPDFYVSGNMFLYYERGNPWKHVSPDVFYVRGVPHDRPRDAYKTWEEGDKGPDLVIELTSRSTRREDEKQKYKLYRDVLGVQEYFLFDPKAEYLKPPLRGYRLVDGKYVPIQAVDGRLPSAVLGLAFECSGTDLRLYSPSQGKWIPTLREARDFEARLRRLAEERSRLAEERSRRAEERSRRAEEELRQERAAWIASERAIERHAEDLAALRRDLEELRRRVSGTP